MLLDRLNEALETIETLDTSGMLQEKVDGIRKEIEYMNLDRRHKTSLFYSTDQGDTYIVDGRDRSVIKTMDERDRVFLAGIISIIASELAPGL